MKFTSAFRWAHKQVAEIKSAMLLCSSVLCWNIYNILIIRKEEKWGTEGIGAEQIWENTKRMGGGGSNSPALQILHGDSWLFCPFQRAACGFVSVFLTYFEQIETNQPHHWLLLADSNTWRAESHSAHETFLNRSVTMCLWRSVSISWLSSPLGSRASFSITNGTLNVGSLGEPTGMSSLLPERFSRFFVSKLFKQKWDSASLELVIKLVNMMQQQWSKTTTFCITNTDANKCYLLLACSV